MVLNRMAARMDCSSRCSLRRLHQRGMEVEIVRHHGGADHADGDDEHAGLAEVAARQSLAHFQETGWVCGSTKISMP